MAAQDRSTHGDVGMGGMDIGDAARRGVIAHLGIETVSATPARVEMRLEVGERVHQPYGILHGGVSALMAESAASLGGALAAEAGHYVVGIELNASHLRPMSEGVLTAVATPVRIGRTVQVWEIVLTDERGREICRSRCTLAVAPLPGEERRPRDAVRGATPVDDGPSGTGAGSTH